MQSEGDGARCVFPEDEDYQYFEGPGTKFIEYTEIKNGTYTWRLTAMPNVDVTNDLASTHQLCQKNEGSQYDSLFTSITALGYPRIRLTSEQTENQLIEILKHMQIIE
jgi:hypothetical protein